MCMYRVKMHIPPRKMCYKGEINAVLLNKKYGALSDLSH